MCCATSSTGWRDQEALRLVLDRLALESMEHIACRPPHPSALETAGEPGATAFQPYVPDRANLPELTISAVLLGSILGIIFGASSLYLFLKVGMTVSASIPVAVLAITIFRGLSRAFGIRRATILENNVVQTAGSAGESIAFGVGAAMPALMLLGYELEMDAGDAGGGAGRIAWHPDDDPAAAGVHRQAARHAAVPRRHRVRQGADRRRAGGLQRA